MQHRHLPRLRPGHQCHCCPWLQAMDAPPSSHERQNEALMLALEHGEVAQAAT